MKETSTEQMDALLVFCPNLDCKARGQVGQANIVIHSRSRPRYRCKACGKTFSAKEGTMFAGLRKPTEVIMTVVTLLAYGCPIQAIVQAFGLDERTVASWRDRAGKHCQQVHQAVVQQGQLDLVHVQADEIRVKGHKMIAWMGLCDDGVDAVMVGRGSEPDARSKSGRSVTPASARLLPTHARAAGVYRWLERVSGQHPAGVSRASQGDSWTRTSLFAGVAAGVYRCGDQTDAKETRGRNHAQGRSGNTEACSGPAFSFLWRDRAQYGFY